MEKQKTFLFLRGLPGTGKSSVAEIVHKKLGWKLFWFHDLKNAIFRIVEVHRIPRLMDEITGPVIRYMLDKGESVVYVRPATDHPTVKGVQEMVQSHPGKYRFLLVQLEASYETLLDRVKKRAGDEYRINTKEDLDRYLKGRERVLFPGEYVIQTDKLTVEQVANEVIKIACAPLD